MMEEARASRLEASERTLLVVGHIVVQNGSCLLSRESTGEADFRRLSLPMSECGGAKAVDRQPCRRTESAVTSPGGHYTR